MIVPDPTTTPVSEPSTNESLNPPLEPVEPDLQGGSTFVSPGEEPPTEVAEAMVGAAEKGLARPRSAARPALDVDPEELLDVESPNHQ